MIKEIQIAVDPRTAYEKALLKIAFAGKLGIPVEDISQYRIQKKSIDARNRDITINIYAHVYIGEMPSDKEYEFHFDNVAQKPPVIIVGAGPAGLFAALKLIECGCKPVILERGKDVDNRKKDITQISREQTINPDSNYCFGEGGAGTFSDGKLYTRSKKRGENSRILELLHFHGADESILYESHPHIGTDKLPGVIVNIRKTILDCGGEIHFDTKVTEFIIEKNVIKGVGTQNNNQFMGKAVVLATGHSARDIYELCVKQEIALEAKPFAMGVRVEHPQTLIDSVQYHNTDRGRYLPAASYQLAAQIEGRGVYSFCMCPGGSIVPSATSSDEIVVNGMSSSQRNTPFANAGIVVEIRLEDCEEYAQHGVLAGLYYQQDLEQLAKQNGGPGQIAPAQRLSDFVSSMISKKIPENSYAPGVIASPLHSWLPEKIRKRLQAGFVQFDKKIRGFLTNNACIVGVESRTSSPVRIVRDRETMQHLTIKGLFPCGEGSGYAGGIASSALDGENAATKIAEYIR